MNQRGTPLSYRHVAAFLREGVDAMAVVDGVALCEKEYTPHSLRVGGCTDLARQGMQGYLIEQRGRWSSKVWKTTYINLDWRDIAKITGKSVSALRAGIASPFVEG